MEKQENNYSQNRGHHKLAPASVFINSLNQRLRWSRGCVLASGAQVRGFKPGRSRRIVQGEKNPQHAFLRRGSKVGGPMS
jgi:hypothetical protein